MSGASPQRTTTSPASGQPGGGRTNGVAGPPAFLLNEKEQIFPARQAFLHPVRAPPQDHPGGALQGAGGFQHVFQKAPTGRPVKDFGQMDPIRVPSPAARTRTLMEFKREVLA